MAELPQCSERTDRRERTKGVSGVTSGRHPDLTDCPVCHSLCLRPTILACGHLVCKKCLRHTLEEKKHNSSCPFCRCRIPYAQGQTINELVDQLGRDLVIEDLITEQLEDQDHCFCVACPNKAATTVCLDCSEMYCASCSSAHKRMAVSKDHVQQALPHAVSNAPRPRISTLTHDVKHARTEHDQNAETLLQTQGAMCEEGVSHLKDAVNVVETNIVQLLKLKETLEKRQQLLTVYVTRLARSDDVLMANTRVMLPRLERVREDCRPPSQAALTTLSSSVNALTPYISRDFSWDPMAAAPKRVFVTKPVVEEAEHFVLDYNESMPLCGVLGTASLMATPDEQLIIADRRNKTIKVMGLTNPGTTWRIIPIYVKPVSFALLRDGQVAVTTDETLIYFVDVSSRKSVVSHMRTSRHYQGIGPGVDDDTLVVSSLRDSRGPASVDVITRSGKVLKTVVDGKTLNDMNFPNHLCVVGGQVLLSDFVAKTVFRVDLRTGRRVHRLSLPGELKPQQIVADSDGYVYIACGVGKCVLVVSPAGQWRTLLSGPKSSVDGCDIPVGVCVTSWGVAVAWREIQRDLYSGYMTARVVAGYDLQKHSL